MNLPRTAPPWSCSGTRIEKPLFNDEGGLVRSQPVGSFFYSQDAAYAQRAVSAHEALVTAVTCLRRLHIAPETLTSDDIDCIMRESERALKLARGDA